MTHPDITKDGVSEFNPKELVINLVKGSSNDNDDVLSNKLTLKQEPCNKEIIFIQLMSKIRSKKNSKLNVSKRDDTNLECRKNKNESQVFYNKYLTSDKLSVKESQH